MMIPPKKYEYISEAEKTVEKINEDYMFGFLTEEERYDNVIKLWENTTKDVIAALQDNFDTYNPIKMMVDSGARGNVTQMRQLAGMRGLMFATNGKTIEIPIKSNFREGLNILEYFMAARGARKSLSDTALRTADSGYLTRRLVDVSQDVIIRHEDCGSTQGIWVSDIKDNNGSVIESLKDRIIGRYAIGDVKDEKGNVIVADNTMITDTTANDIVKAGVEKVLIRTILQCKCAHGVCAHCYGSDLASGKTVSIGETVGIIAAQSIGEPGTQLTMRTFHTGGVAGSDITQGLPRVEELFEGRKPKKVATPAEVSGTVSIGDVRNNNRMVTVSNDLTGESVVHSIPVGTHLAVTDGQYVLRGEPLTDGNLSPADITRLQGLDAVYDYIIREVQRVYRSQSVEINDKHIEVIARQMTRKVRIDESGDTDLLFGSLVNRSEFETANEEIDKRIAAGEITLRHAESTPVLLGITKAAISTDSFLSAASFQETTKVLTEAAIKGKIDHLLGLKENVIIGKLIPAGTGMQQYRSVEVETNSEDLSATVDGIVYSTANV
jgi:DNA-directed RNA polymerase subunit beta'